MSSTNWLSAKNVLLCYFFFVSKLSYSFAVMPENANFPYRRYDRLPPIHQFSIESDTDLSETAELIEEYEVFDPSRPRPKIILVIGMKTESKILVTIANFVYIFIFQKIMSIMCCICKCLVGLKNDKQ